MANKRLYNLTQMEVIAEKNDYLLIQGPTGFTVVRTYVDAQGRTRVASAMPRDLKEGPWDAISGDAGVRFVTSNRFHTRGYARRIFSKLTKKENKSEI